MSVEDRSYRVPRAAGVVERARAALADSPGLPAQAVALAALVYLAATDGGYYPVDWYPVGLGILALVAVWAAFVPPAAPRGPLAFAAAALLVAFGGWSLLSIAWAGEPAASWDAGNRALLYAAVFALFALWPAPARDGRWLLAALGLGIAAIGVVELVRWSAAADPHDYMSGGRFSEPVGYHNGNVALWTMGAFACLAVATMRELAPPVRGLALGAVPVLASLALLGQSRGSLFAIPVALAILFAMAPGRLRLLAAVGLSALGVAVAIGPVLEVVDAAGVGTLPRLIDDAARSILLPGAVLAAIGALAALADRRWTPSPAMARRTSRVAGAIAATLALVAVVVAATQAGGIQAEVSDRWDQFKSSESAGSGTARLGSGGTNRYDFWTVAWDIFEREPVRGVGADNFQQDYLAEGGTSEKPRFPHSLELALLSGTGIIGALLFLAALVAALLAAVSSRWRHRWTEGAVAAGAAAVFVYFFFHTSVDWLYEVPGLGALSFVCLGLAAGGGGEMGRPARRLSIAARLAPALLAVAAAVSFALPWLAEREIERALDVWRGSPDAAYERLDRAAGMNPLSVRPALFEAMIALERDAPRRAEAAFRAAVQREPRNAHAWLELAALASGRQDRAEARRLVARAYRLSPNDEAVRVARRAILAGERFTPEQLLAVLLENAR